MHEETSHLIRNLTVQKEVFHNTISKQRLQNFPLFFFFPIFLDTYVKMIMFSTFAPSDSTEYLQFCCWP